VAKAHAVPGVARLLRAAEFALADAPIARGLGGFVIAVARKPS
jgi:hypothetical protein